MSPVSFELPPYIANILVTKNAGLPCETFVSAGERERNRAQLGESRIVVVEHEAGAARRQPIAATEPRDVVGDVAVPLSGNAFPAA